MVLLWRVGNREIEDVVASELSTTDPPRLGFSNREAIRRCQGVINMFKVKVLLPVDHGGTTWIQVSVFVTKESHEIEFALGPLADESMSFEHRKLLLNECRSS